MAKILDLEDYRRAAHSAWSHLQDSRALLALDELRQGLEPFAELEEVAAVLRQAKWAERGIVARLESQNEDFDAD